MAIDPDNVLSIVRMKGPVLPAQIAKEISTNILFASAVLSELASSNKIKISHVKIGSSPLYYAPGQESRLQNFANYLHEKEKKAYDILQQKKIVRDKEADPVLRVALRNMKDFAVPLNVTVKGEKEVFWKWYLAKNEEAEPLIRKEMGIEVKVPKTEEKPVEKKESKKEKFEGQEAQNPPEKEKHINNGEFKREQPKKQEKSAPSKKPSEFLQEITSYLAKNNATILEREVIRKGREVDFMIQVGSAFGLLTYYCRAKHKARVTDADLSSAYVQGQLKKLPVIFLSTGEPTKKAKEMLGKEFKTIVFRKI